MTKTEEIMELAYAFQAANRGTYAERETALKSAIEELVADRWQPIEAAPKDATSILIHCPSARKPVQEVWWSIHYEGSPEGYWSTPVGPLGRGYIILPTSATHWMPLPQPPKATP